MAGELTTVVIPVWDAYAEGLMSAALPSLQSQDVCGRIVVVDNASETKLADMQGVEVVRSPVRLSLGATRNLGLEHVATPYVMFWDADDAMLPGTLRLLEQALGRDPSVVAFGAGIVEDVSGLRHRWPRRWMANITVFPLLFRFVDCIWSLYPSTGATLMRTSAVREAGGYADADSGEDWCLGVSLAFRGQIGWTERPGRVYRIHESSMWARHMTVAHQLHHARAVRRRIRSDPGAPRWVRAALPVIQLGQYAAIAAHVVVATARRTFTRRQTGR